MGIFCDVDTLVIPWGYFEDTLDTLGIPWNYLVETIISILRDIPGITWEDLYIGDTLG